MLGIRVGTQSIWHKMGITWIYTMDYGLWEYNQQYRDEWNITREKKTAMIRKQVWD